MITVAITRAAVDIGISVSIIPTLAEARWFPPRHRPRRWKRPGAQPICRVFGPTKPTRLTPQGRSGHSTQVLDVSSEPGMPGEEIDAERSDEVLDS
jgi:hypothetical protein